MVRLHSNNPSGCRGRLQPEFGGGEIAVKVQRPGVLLSVSLDLFLMRYIAMFLDGLVRLEHWPCLSFAGLIAEPRVAYAGLQYQNERQFSKLYLGTWASNDKGSASRSTR